MRTALVFLIIAASSGASAREPAKPILIECDTGLMLRDIERSCSMTMMRAAAEPYNAGVSQEAWANNGDRCVSDQTASLELQRRQFLQTHQKQINRLKPRFTVERASEDDWYDLLFRKLNICLQDAKK